MRKAIPFVLLAAAVLIVVLVNFLGLTIIPQSPWNYATKIDVYPLSKHVLEELPNGVLELNTYMPTQMGEVPGTALDDVTGDIMIVVDLAFDILPVDASINAERYNAAGERIWPVSITVVSNRANPNPKDTPEYIDNIDKNGQEVEDDPKTQDREDLKPNPDYISYYRVKREGTHFYVFIFATGQYLVDIKVNENNGTSTAGQRVNLWVFEKEYYLDTYGTEGG